MAKLDADMQSLVRRTISCFAATINGDGSPNLSPKSTLIVQRVSQINNCAYCLDMHTRDLLKKGQKVRHRLLSGRSMGGLRNRDSPVGS